MSSNKKNRGKETGIYTNDNMDIIGEIMKDDIKETSVDLIALNIQKTLAKEGFIMSRENPFFNWIRGEQATSVVLAN